jgi:hypothetical protein
MEEERRRTTDKGNKTTLPGRSLFSGYWNRQSFFIFGREIQKKSATGYQASQFCLDSWP